MAIVNATGEVERNGNMKIELRLVNDDWQELVIDDNVVMEGHSLLITEVIRSVAPDAEFSLNPIFRCVYCEKEMPDSGDGFRCGDCL